jgi:hypothetical protein
MRVKLLLGAGNAGVDQRLSPCSLRTLRVAGTAALAGIVQIKQGGSVIETLAAATAVGVERDYDDMAFDSTNGQLDINIANAADAVLAFYT